MKPRIRLRAGLHIDGRSLWYASSPNGAFGTGFTLRDAYEEWKLIQSLIKPLKPPGSIEYCAPPHPIGIIERIASWLS